MRTAAVEMHMPATVDQAPSRPLVFLDLEGVLVVGAERNQELRYLPLLYCLKVEMAGNDMATMWSELVDTEARTNLHRLHAEFSPRYVLCGPVAHAMERGHLIDMLRRADLACIAEHLHPAWRTEFLPGAPALADVATWMKGYMRGGPPFVVLGNTKRSTSVEFAAADRRVVVCSAEEGLSTTALHCAVSILRVQRDLPVGLRRT